jgi:hypothetical protein
MKVIENHLRAFSFKGYSREETGRIKLDSGPAVRHAAG